MKLNNCDWTPRVAETRRDQSRAKEDREMKNMNSLIAAYLAVWAIFFVYEFTVSRRLANLRDEVQRLKQTFKR
jgi:CcmD family protein